MQGGWDDNGGWDDATQSHGINESGNGDWRPDPNQRAGGGMLPDSLKPGNAWGPSTTVKDHSWSKSSGGGPPAPRSRAKPAEPADDGWGVPETKGRTCLCLRATWLSRHDD